MKKMGVLFTQMRKSHIQITYSDTKNATVIEHSGYMAAEKLHI